MAGLRPGHPGHIEKYALFAPGWPGQAAVKPGHDISEFLGRPDFCSSYGRIGGA